jgi:hypothetical protein
MANTSFVDPRSNQHSTDATTNREAMASQCNKREEGRDSGARKVRSGRE